ncbi:YceI family protein [Thauera sinica]|uniref:YceI family protein n=1 Tax=Thauera sinica TaxID=2665146 RepID=A0ABW1AML0_9RHOO|nr:YceI family protein [Thauera sp. K11]ATE62641.1 polyisoprenoid-binding protein [Thauera sp. K11]
MKQSTRLAFALAAALGATLPPAALAVEYNQVQAGKSSIAFGYKQMGVAMDGRFRKFTSQLSFDPAQPANAKAAIEVDLASVDTGGAESDGEVAGKEWFNTKAFPTARFESGTVKALGGNRYEVAGKLTIKGKTRDVVVPATFTPQGNTGTFDGSFTIRRGDFTVGEGAWSAFDIVANDVQIKFRIAASGK